MSNQCCEVMKCKLTKNCMPAKGPLKINSCSLMCSELTSRAYIGVILRTVTSVLFNEMF